MKGSYVLLIELPEEQTITTGSLEALYFPCGYYAYVGSAMGGFKSRLNYHLQKSKRPHWHIDYLLQKASVSGIILCQTEERVECLIAQELSRQFSSIPGFGSSDCKCHSHLFFATDGSQINSTIMATLKLLGIRPSLAKRKFNMGGDYT